MERQIISYNMAGWNWKLTDEGWKERLTRSCEYIINKTSEPMIIGLQEVQLGGGRYLDILKNHFPEYHIILPLGYRNQPKSVISIILIRKDLCESYSIATLDNLKESLRYNFVTFNTTDGFCFRVLNTNIPHTCYEKKADWFKENRRILRKTFLDEIISLAETYRNEADVKFIALGDFNTVPDDSFIEALAYSYIDRPMIDPVAPSDKNKITWKNLGSKNRLDYILYSQGMLCDTGMSVKITRVDDTTITSKMSDHAVLVGGVVY